MPKAKKHAHKHHHRHEHEHVSKVLPDLDTPEFEAYHARRTAELMATYDRRQAKRYKRLGIENPIAGMHHPDEVKKYYREKALAEEAAKAGKSLPVVAPAVVLVPDAPAAPAAAAAAAPSRAGRKRITPTLIAPLVPAAPAAAAAPAVPDELASVTTALIPEGHGKAPTATSRHFKAGKASVLKKRKSRKSAGKSLLVRCGAVLGECRNLVRGEGRCHLHHGRRVMP